jgi:hypothetical protein
VVNFIKTADGYRAETDHGVFTLTKRPSGFLMMHLAPGRQYPVQCGCVQSLKACTQSAEEVCEFLDATARPTRASKKNS